MEETGQLTGRLADAAIESMRVASPPAPIENRLLSIAVIGFGHWGPNHVRCLQCIPGCKITVVDSVVARLDRLAMEHPQLRRESDFASVLGDNSIDAVVIATPTASHAKLVRQALESNKHVLCEKPLCCSSEEAQNLVALAQSRSLVLMTGHIFLFNPGISKVKELIDQGELGKILYLSAERTNFGPIRHDVNAAYDLASHDLAVFNWLLGDEPVEVSATGGMFVRRGIHDVVFITVRYPGGRMGHIHASWLNPHKVRKMTIVGDRRMVAWNDLEPTTPVAIFDCGAMVEGDASNFGEFQRETMWSGEVRLPKIDATEPLKAQDQAFIDAVRRGGPYRSDGPFAASVVKALDMVSLSLARGGAPVHVSEIAHEE